MASILWVLVSTPFILSRYVFDIICCIPPWGRPSPEWNVEQAIRVRTVRLLLLYWSLLRTGDNLKLAPGREGNRFEIIKAKSSKLYKGPLSDSTIHPETIGATWTPEPPPPVGTKATVVLHFHGGAYVIGNGRDEDTGYLARTLVRHLGCAYVCTPQYRLSSQRDGKGRFPAALQDALTSYLHLTNELGIPATQIVFSGDSAGGNLALGLLRYISEYGRELNIPIPAAVMLWSPWTDIGAALDVTLDIRTLPSYSTDYLNAEFPRWGSRTLTGYGAVDGAGPYLSPLHHPFKMDVEVPMFVNGGSREVLCDDIKAFSKLFEKHGWPLHLVISKGCPHDVLLLGPRMGFQRAAEEAVRDARAFFSSTTKLHLGAA